MLANLSVIDTLVITIDPVGAIPSIISARLIYRAAADIGNDFFTLCFAENYLKQDEGQPVAPRRRTLPAMHNARHYCRKRSIQACTEVQIIFAALLNWIEYQLRKTDVIY